MHRRPLLELLERYLAHNPEERIGVDHVRQFVRANPDCFERSCVDGHLTASAWIVSYDQRRFLLAHHRKLGRWLQLGGHADGEEDVSLDVFSFDVVPAPTPATQAGSSKLSMQGRVQVPAGARITGAPRLKVKRPAQAATTLEFQQAGCDAHQKAASGWSSPASTQKPCLISKAVSSVRGIGSASAQPAAAATTVPRVAARSGALVDAVMIDGQSIGPMHWFQIISTGRSLGTQFHSFH